MEILQKRFDSRLLAVLGALGCVLLASLGFAAVSSAAVPEAGQNCVESEGKISGAGSTYQNNLQEEVAKFYRNDFCGATGVETAEDKIGGTERGEAGNTMIAYNYPGAEKNKGTGSGAGLKAASCRTEAFFGTDLPYSLEQLEWLDEAPGTLVEAHEGVTCASTIKGKFDPPFQPDSPEEWPDKAAGKEDTTATLMSFPIGGSSVALPVYLTAATCENNAANVPTSLEFTTKEVSRLLGGEAKEWNEAELIANNPALKHCPTKITRVVRFDNSGTTSILKNYLIREEGNAGGGERKTYATCAPANNWTAYPPGKNPNTEWPGKQEPGKEGACSEITTAGENGGPALITKLKATPGGIGYADLSNAAPPEGAGLILPTVENGEESGAEPPSEGNAANCTYKVVTLPKGSTSNDVGLNPRDNWSNNNETIAGNENHENATDKGKLYPICGLTFDLVYTGLHVAAGGANPISRLSNDQRRTLYSYMTYLLSPIAQEKLGTIEYHGVPESWLPLLRAGFQKNF